MAVRGTWLATHRKLFTAHVGTEFPLLITVRLQTLIPQRERQ